MTGQAALARRRLETAAAPPLRVMIVDDSAVARAVLSRMIATYADFEIVATAGNAGEALDALKVVRADVILLDVEMPGASGLQALPDIIRAGKGARVLIVSSMAEDGAATTVNALAEGAADTLPKPGIGNFAGRFSQVLADKLRRLGRAEREPDIEVPAAAAAPIRLRVMEAGPLGCVALAASTGGLPALFDFLRPLPKKIGVPILVTQHLPALFMSHFARQLTNASGRKARVAEDGELLADDLIHVAPGDAHLCVERAADGVRVRLDRKRAPSGCRPSADPMLASVAETYGPAGIGVVLSGMGRDGLIGSRRLVEKGGAMLAQDRHSAAIWGMPRAVAEAGLAAAVLPPAELARRVAERAAWR
ncbi:MAG: two-component system, chemotaxis family, protein-glutamate methylesterase/glutaminase [Sphingomonadales bacterium]|nr:two-component system, chemotaxis family, protein-glutamate methylesterase/glutaminase [Sphingomonadales bacterium]MEA3044248.1 two-component system, chemotaxis family, protein-glutamate methylesterase/glutaminase [Sphingomonadales bacterium]